MRHTAGPEIEKLIALLAKLPGLGPRSARRAVLHLLRNRESIMAPLGTALSEAQARVMACTLCGNLDVQETCAVCRDPGRDTSVICVVEQVSDLWALERGQVFRGRYHVLGGVLSAIDGIGPDELRLGRLVERATAPEVREVILALNATVDGQTTAHYIADALVDCDVSLSGLAHGMPVGGELDYMDDGTIAAALGARRTL